MTERELQRLEKETKEKAEIVCNQLGTYFHHVRETVNKLSLRELYKKSGVSIALISAFEDGKKLPRIETIIKLMTVLDIPYKEVFGHKLAGMDFLFEVNQRIKLGTDNPLRQFLSTQGFDKDEIKDIIKYTDFIKYRRK